MQRRKFLRNIGAGVAIPSLINGFGVNAFATNPSALLSSGFSTDTDHVLVLINLAGGNDGLNTVIPLDQYNFLQKARPEVILDEAAILPLSGTNTVGLHPALSGFQRLYNDGNLKVVQNVGYPDPNFSHFRAADIWMSGSDADKFVSTGWAGRYLNYEYPNFPVDYPNDTMPHPLAVEIGYAQSMALMGPQSNMGYVVADIDSFYKLVEGRDTPTPNTPAGEQLRYIRQISRQSRAYAQALTDAASRVTTQRNYPDTQLAAKLKIVARLIAGGLKTRIYMVTIDGFDTHDSQVDKQNHAKGWHARLLDTLGNAVSAFTRDLDFLGISDRVTGMTFSEFGRRVASNASGGTDHGAAAPLFLFGKPIAGGIVGKNPIIPRFVNENYSMPMKIDFRSVYGTLLRDWMCVPETDVHSILQQPFPFIDLFQEGLPCISTDIAKGNKEAGVSLIRVAPNPVRSVCQIDYVSRGGQVVIHILDVSGKIVATPVNTKTTEGQQMLQWSMESLPAGTYYYRLMNDGVIQTKMVVKV